MSSQKPGHKLQLLHWLEYSSKASQNGMMIALSVTAFDLPQIIHGGHIHFTP
jgi:hypothetical protein